MRQSILKTALLGLLAAAVVGMACQDANGQQASKHGAIYMESFEKNGKPVYHYGALDEKPTYKGGGPSEYYNWFRHRRDNKGPRVPGLKIRYTYIIDTEGKVHDLTVTAPTEYEQRILDKILKNKKVPDWTTPGKMNGEPVNTYVVYLVTYIGD